MSISNYKRSKLQNPYAPLYSTFSIYGSRNTRPSLFSPRRTMSASKYTIGDNPNSSHSEVPSRSISHSSSSRSHTSLHDDSSHYSVISINSTSTDSNQNSDLEVVAENRGVLTNIKTNFLDSGRRVLNRFLGSSNQSDSNVIDLTKDEDSISMNNKRTAGFHNLDINNKKRKLDKENKTEDLSIQKVDSIPKLEISNDPFGWNKWETTEIGKYDTITNKQYGTRFLRRHKQHKESINDTRMILSGRSDEVAYLRQIFNGKYEIPKIISDERDEQLRLLERDRQVGRKYNTGIKKSIIDITEKIRDILIENREKNKFHKNKERNDDDIIFVKEHKLTSLEKKRQDFYNESLKLDKTLLEFENEFKNYKQLIEERKKIQEDIRNKRAESKQLKNLVPKLDNTQINQVKKTFNRGDNGILTSKDYLEVTVRDFKTLAPKRWLNDTIIEYFMKQIEKTTKNTVAFNSFFYSTLSERGYQGVRRWMKRKKVQITNLDKVFVPINLNQSHWALGMIDIKNERVIYVDSLSHGPNAMSFAILNDLKSYVVQESKNTIGKDFQLSHISCPQQPNGFDCGIYVCLNTLYLSKDSDLTFNYDDASRMRTYIALLILNDV